MTSKGKPAGQKRAVHPRNADKSKPSTSTASTLTSASVTVRLVQLLSAMNASLQCPAACRTLEP